MMFLHELGHFLVSKAFGVEVEEFGLGLPPRICKLFTWKGTEFTLNAIPFGAFVRPKGEHEDEGETSLRGKAAWKQILILLAGPAMNLLTASVIYIFCISQIGFSDTSRVVIDTVAPESPAEAAGFLPGDRLLESEGTVITDLDSITPVTKSHLGQEMHVTISRSGETMVMTVIPNPEPPEGQGPMGIVITYPLLPATSTQSIGAGFREMAFMVKQYLIGLGQMISGEVQMGLDSIVGPVGMYSYYAEAAEMDAEEQAEAEAALAEREKAGGDMDVRTASTVKTPWINRLSFFALISVCLGVTNLFPIPALDGGRILFLLPDLLFGKKVPQKVENICNSIFMIILMMLMFAVMFKDINMMGK